MRLPALVERWQQWKTVMPLYDGRECPDCGAVCIGKGARRTHREWHIDRTEFDSRAVDALRRLIREAGLNPVESAELSRGELPEGYNQLGDLDERLTAKARAVAELDDYDDEEDEDDQEDDDEEDSDAFRA